MEIAFETKELRDLCHHEAVSNANLSTLAAEALKKRLSDIHAADWIGEILAGRPKIGRWKTYECYFFDLEEGLVLAVIPNHLKQRLNNDGQVDWATVRRVKIVYLGERNESLR